MKYALMKAASLVLSLAVGSAAFAEPIDPKIAARVDRVLAGNTAHRRPQ